MAEKVEIRIVSSFDAAGATAAAKALQTLVNQTQAAMRSAAKGGAGAGGFSQLSKEAQAAAIAQQKLAQEAAKTATAQANAATAAQRQAAAQSAANRAITEAAAAQQRLARDTANAAAAQTRAEAAAQRLAAAQQKAAAAAGAGANGARSWTSAVSGSLGKIDALIGSVTQLGGAFAVFGAAQAVYGIAQTGAAAEAAKASFYSLAEAAGQSGQALLDALTKASGGAVAQADVIGSANTALLLLGSEAADKLPKLMEIARASATTLGTDVGMVFDSLITGISRNSTELIDNAGITVKAGDAYAAYGAAIGKSADALSAAEKQQAILNAVLTSGQDILNRTAGAGQTNLESFQRFEAGINNLTNALGAMIAGGLAPAAEFFGNLANKAAEAIPHLGSLGEKIAGTEGAILASASSYEEYAAKIAEANAIADDTGSVTERMLINFEQLTEAGFGFAQGMVAAGTGTAEIGAVMDQLSATMPNVSGAFATLASDASLAAGQQQAIGAQMGAVAGSSAAAAVAVDNLAASYTMGMINAEQLAAGLQILQANQQAVAGASGETINQVALTAQAYAEGRITSEEFSTALQNLLYSQIAATAATQEGTAATVEEDRATRDAAVAKADAANAADEQAGATAALSAEQAIARVEADLLAEKQRQLMEAAEGAAMGSGSIEDAAARLAGQFPITAAEAAVLIARLRELQAIQGKTLPGYGGRAPGDVGRAEAAAKANPATPPARGGRAGRGGGGGGARARANEAQKAADQLVDIQQRAADRIAEINAQTAERLVEIDRKAAEERARIAQQLADDIATSQANQIAQQEANDLEAVGETDEKRLRAIAAREKAETAARERMAAAAAQAQEELAAAGTAEDAAAAEARYEAQKQYIADRQALDEAYEAKRAELAGNPEALAELERQYQEAVAAAEAARDQELAVELAKIEAKRQAREAEKAEVIANAEAQKQEVIAKAVEQAEKVKGASADQKAAVVADLQAQGQAATDWAAATEAAAARVAEAYAKAAAAAASVPGPPASGGDGGAAGGATAAAGGGTFVTTGRTSLIVGDNPGGKELVTVTPLSGRGRTRVGKGMIALAGGGAVLAGGGGRIRERPAEFADRGGAPRAIADIVDAAKRAFAAAGAQQGRPSGGAGADTPTPPSASPGASGGASGASGGGGSVGAGVASIARAALGDLTIGAEELKAYVEQAEAVVSLLEAISAMQAQLATARPQAIDVATLEALADNAALIAATVTQTLVPTGEEGVTGLDAYADAVAAAVEIIGQVIELGARLQGRIAPPIDPATIRQLAADAAGVVDLITGSLNPDAALIAVELELYVRSVAGAADLLLQVVELGARVQGRIPPPIDATILRRLAEESRRANAIAADALVPVSEAMNAALAAYVEATQTGIDLLLSVVELGARVQGRIPPPISADAVRALATDAQRVGGIIGGTLLPISERDMEMLRRYAEAVAGSMEILTSILDIRDRLPAAPPAPISADAVRQLAAEAQQVGGILGASLVPVSERDLEVLNRYRDAVAGGIAILAGVLDLRGQIAEGVGGPIPIDLVRALALEAQRIGDIVGRSLLPISEQDLALLSRYAETVAASLDILAGVLDLRQQVADGAGSPLSPTLLRTLAAEAQRAASIVRAALIPVSEDEADALSRYADAVGASVDILTGVLSLRQQIADAKGGPIDAALVARLADDARRATAIVRERLLPTSEAEADALSRYADAAGASVGILGDVLSLTGDLFTDYRSPTDATLNMLASDAQRITAAFQRGAAILGTDGAAQAKAYGEALAAVFGAAREGLLVVDALTARDYAIDPRRLAQFEASTGAIIATSARLGAQAAGVGSAQFAALRTFGETLTTVAEGIAALSSVPFDNLSQFQAGLSQIGLGSGGGGGGAASTTITVAPGAIVINQQPGQDASALAQQVIRQLNTMIGGRR